MEFRRRMTSNKIMLEEYYHIVVMKLAWHPLVSVSPTARGCIAHMLFPKPPDGCVSRCRRTASAECWIFELGISVHCPRSRERLQAHHIEVPCRPVRENLDHIKNIQYVQGNLTGVIASQFPVLNRSFQLEFN